MTAAFLLLQVTGSFLIGCVLQFLVLLPALLARRKNDNVTHWTEWARRAWPWRVAVGINVGALIALSVYITRDQSRDWLTALQKRPHQSRLEGTAQTRAPPEAGGKMTGSWRRVIAGEPGKAITSCR